jgi:phenylglyoxylate dehydrogenase epsilon subunit
MAKKHLIIGSGIAALSATRMIRKVNTDDEIKMVTMEDCLPYSPAVLPYLISKRIDENNISLADENFFEKMGCSLEKAKEVVHLRTDTKEIVYRDGERDSYDTLLIASGSEPMKPPIQGLEEVGFIGCHTLADCRNIIQKLENKKKVTLYGAGLVSLEIAAALLEAGYGVDIVARSRILRRYFDNEPIRIISNIFQQHGGNFYNGKEIIKVDHEGSSIKMNLADGTFLTSDLLICCLGVTPRTGFLINTDIKVNDGVLVDRNMRTNVPDVYAAGDVVESTDYFFNQPGINAIAPNAITQGRIAGANMAGENVADRGWISMNVFKFFGHTAFSIGLPGTEGFYTLRKRGPEDFKELVFKDDKLVGARFIDIEIDPGVFRYLIEGAIDVEQKEMLFDRPREVSLWLMMENEQGTRIK